MGTPDISRTCLEKIRQDGFEIVGVYTKPDMPKNRGMKLAMSEVKQYALAENLPVYQPRTFRDDAVVQELKDLQPDVLVVHAVNDEEQVLGVKSQCRSKRSDSSAWGVCTQV